MFLLNTTNYKYSNSYMMIGLGLGGHFQKALNESGKVNSSFLYDDIDCVDLTQ